MTDGVKETGAASSTSRGGLGVGGSDITKEALTAGCDIAEQTAGASASMGKQHYGPAVNRRGSTI